MEGAKKFTEQVVTHKLKNETRYGLDGLGIEYLLGGGRGGEIFR